jgi:hypothetical protein
MAETYGRYDLAMGCRRTAASPSYEIGRRATGGGSETDERTCFHHAQLLLDSLIFVCCPGCASPMRSH